MRGNQDAVAPRPRSSLPDLPYQPFQPAFRGLTLPYGEHAPPVSSQRTRRAPVPPNVYCELGAPERDVALRHRGFETTDVPVPKATMNEQRDASARKYYIG